MADISEQVEKIRGARFGPDVREAMASALEAMNENAEAAEEWATGGEGGTPSATNNAKYYAEQAAASTGSIAEARKVAEVSLDVLANGDADKTITTTAASEKYTSITDLPDTEYLVKLTFESDNDDVIFGIASSGSAANTNIYFIGGKTAGVEYSEDVTAGEYWFTFTKNSTDHRFMRLVTGSNTPVATVAFYQTKTSALDDTIIGTSYADKSSVYKAIRLPNSAASYAVTSVHKEISELGSWLENGEYYAIQLVLANDEEGLTFSISSATTAGTIELFVDNKPMKAGVYLFAFRKTAAMQYIRLKNNNDTYPANATVSLFGLLNAHEIKTNRETIQQTLRGIATDAVKKKPISSIATDIADLRDGYTYVLRLTLNAANAKLSVGLSSTTSLGGTTQTLMTGQSVLAGDRWFAFRKTSSDKYLYVYDGSSYPSGTIMIYASAIDADKTETDRLADVYEQKLARREQYLRDQHSGGADVWYGVEWTEGETGVDPINSTGDAGLHTTLPIQSKMRRCVVKNGKVVYYLKATDSTKIDDDNDTPANLDGTDGDVCVEIPEFFFKFEESTVDDKRHIQLKISEQGLNGYTYSPKYYVGAYEATIDRVNNVLVSVCTTNFTAPELVAIKTDSDSYIKNNTDKAISRGGQYVVEIDDYTENAKDYRGGNNNDAYDDIDSPINVNYWHNHLGRPVAELCKDEMETYTDKRHGKFIYLYNAHRALWILSTVEFKTKNIQAVSLPSYGATTFPSSGDGYYAFKQWCIDETESVLPCGITNSLGNNTGKVFILLKNAPISITGTYPNASLTGFADIWVPCMSYRGVEHYWGHIYKTMSQLLITSQFDHVEQWTNSRGEIVNEDISNVQYYYQPNPYRRDNTDVEPVAVTEIAAHTREISSYVFGPEGHILPKAANRAGNYTSGTDYCDCVEIYTHRDCVYQADVNGSLINLNLPGRNMIVGGFAASGIDVYNDYNGLAKKSVRGSNGTRITYAV